MSKVAGVHGPCVGRHPRHGLVLRVSRRKVHLLQADGYWSEEVIAVYRTKDEELLTMDQVRQKISAEELPSNTMEILESLKNP